MHSAIVQLTIENQLKYFIRELHPKKSTNPSLFRDMRKKFQLK